MSLTGKTLANTYKDLLQMNNSNSGIDTGTKVIVDGEGTESALHISDDIVKVFPKTDDTTTAFTVLKTTGATLFHVDTLNSAVKGGSGLNYMNTHQQNFSVCRAVATADTHYSMSMGGATGQRTGADLGTGTDPSTTYDLSADTTYPETVSGTYWYLPSAVVIDSVTVLATGYGTDTGTDLPFHLMSYAMSIGGGTEGDLSDGTVLFNSPADIEDVVETKIILQTLSSVNTNVSAGRVIVATFEESVSAGANATANMTVKYHLL